RQGKRTDSFRTMVRHRHPRSAGDARASTGVCNRSFFIIRKRLMSRRHRRRNPGHLFYNAAEDLQHARRDMERCTTPQLESPAYRLAFDDSDFLTREELRGVRLMLELNKPEM